MRGGVVGGGLLLLAGFVTAAQQVVAATSPPANTPLDIRACTHGKTTCALCPQDDAGPHCQYVSAVGSSLLHCCQAVRWGADDAFNHTERTVCLRECVHVTSKPTTPPISGPTAPSASHPIGKFPTPKMTVVMTGVGIVNCGPSSNCDYCPQTDDGPHCGAAVGATGRCCQAVGDVCIRQCILKTAAPTPGTPHPTAAPTTAPHWVPILTHPLGGYRSGSRRPSTLSTAPAAIAVAHHEHMLHLYKAREEAQHFDGATPAAHDQLDEAMAGEQ